MERKITSFAEAMLLLDEYISAYHELARENLRVTQRYLNARIALAHARAAIDNDLWAEEQAKTVESECPF